MCVESEVQGVRNPRQRRPGEACWETPPRSCRWFEAASAPSRGPGERSQKKEAATKEGGFSCTGVCRRAKAAIPQIDSCWIINYSSAAGFPFRQKCPENIPAALFNEAENTSAASSRAAGAETDVWDETRPSLRLRVFPFPQPIFIDSSTLDVTLAPGRPFILKGQASSVLDSHLLRPHRPHPGPHWSHIRAGAPPWGRACSGGLSGGLSLQRETGNPSRSRRVLAFRQSYPVS